MRFLQPMRRSWSALAALAGLAAFEATRDGFGRAASVHAATTCTPCSVSAKGTVETANFRIVPLGGHVVSRATADACEKLRNQLVQRWLGQDVAGDWSPKCDIVLHSSDSSYLRAVGEGGGSTVASSWVERQTTGIAKRRIDIRSARGAWLDTALGHELTHVVLADLVACRSLPRWLDEGVAILADPVDKQRRHRKDLEQAIQRGSQFRLLELISLGDDYPPNDRWGTFYGQSASVVQFLVKQGGERQLAEFARVALEQGHEQGLMQVYHCGLPELERRWQAHLRTPAGDHPADKLKSAGRSPHAIAMQQP